MKIPVPREHGAWAMLYTPFLTALLTARVFDWRVVFLFISLTAIFFAHEPLLVAARTKDGSIGATTRKRSSFRWTGFYLLVALIACVPLFLLYRLWLLMVPGILMFALLAFHYRLVLHKQERSIGAEFLAIASLTASAPATWYALRGALDAEAFLLWVLNGLYFTSSIFYVKVLVSRFAHKPNAPGLVAESIAYHACLILVLAIFYYLNLIPFLALAAFAPAIARAGWSLKAGGFHLNLRRVGMAEMGFTVLFLILLTTALHR